MLLLLSFFLFESYSALLLLLLSFPFFCFRLWIWICAGCDEEKIGPCFWLFSDWQPSLFSYWFQTEVLCFECSPHCELQLFECSPHCELQLFECLPHCELRWWIMNKLRMSDFGDASGIHEKIFHITEQCTYSSQKKRKQYNLKCFSLDGRLHVYGVYYK